MCVITTDNKMLQILQMLAVSSTYSSKEMDSQIYVALYSGYTLM